MENMEEKKGRGLIPTEIHVAAVVLFLGTIKTALPGMDREVKENYQVVIQAKDMAGQMGGLSGTTTVSITLSDVNDSPPRFANRKIRLPSPVWRQIHRTYEHVCDKVPTLFLKKKFFPTYRFFPGDCCGVRRGWGCHRADQGGRSGRRPQR